MLIARYSLTNQMPSRPADEVSSPFRRALLAEDFLPYSIEYRTDDKEWHRNDFPHAIDDT